jgi:hypothetical protein
MNRFIAGDRAPSSPEGAKMLACTHPAFDGPMVVGSTATFARPYADEASDNSQVAIVHSEENTVFNPASTRKDRSPADSCGPSPTGLLWTVGFDAQSVRAAW